ncbi:unnamed protein product, partial [Effrenium voratum]
PRGAVIPVEGLAKLRNLTPNAHTELVESGETSDAGEGVVPFLLFWKVLEERDAAVDEAPMAAELRGLRQALLGRLDRNGGTVSSNFLLEAVRRAHRKSADPTAWRPLKEVVANVAAAETSTAGWWGQHSLKLAPDELSSLLLPWLQELVEDYCRGSRSAKIFCVKDVAGVRVRDACLHLCRNEWDVEAALQSFFDASKKVGKEALSWSSGGAKLRQNERDCPICVEKYSTGNKSIMTKCCFQVLCERCHQRLTDSTGRLSCPFCRGADGLQRVDFDFEELRSSGLQRTPTMQRSK